MRRRFFRILSASLVFFSLAVAAEERIVVCFNYGCFNTAEVTFTQQQLDEAHDLLAAATSAEFERELIAVLVGRLLGWAGQQSPIHVDRGGNYADEGISGKMDCIDHSTTTTRLLKMLEKRGWLRWHRVLAPVVRSRILVFDHWSAVIEQFPLAPYRSPEQNADLTPRYAVDSWFRDNGKPAVVVPLGQWMEWKDPDDEM